MKKELRLSPTFEKDFAFSVMVDGIVIAFCHSYSAANILASSYRGPSSRPGVEVVLVRGKFGEVFME